MDHIFNDVMLYLLLHIPECIAYYVLNNASLSVLYIRNQTFTLAAFWLNFKVF